MTENNHRYAVSVTWQRVNGACSTTRTVLHLITRNSQAGALEEVLKTHWPESEEGESSWHLAQFPIIMEV